MSTLKVNTITNTSGNADIVNVGKIVQVKTVTKTDTFTTSSTSYTDITGLSTTLTCASSTNKVLIRYDVLFGGDFWTAGPAYLGLVVDSTRIAKGTTGADSDKNSTTFQNFYANNVNNSNQNISTSTCSFLYTPGDASSHTYKIQARMQNSAGICSVNRTGYTTDYSGISTLTLMEVAA